MNSKSVVCGKIGTYKMFQWKLTFLAFTSAEIFTKSEKSNFWLMVFSIERVAREFNVSYDTDEFK
jgi:hypothetical protein